MERPFPENFLISLECRLRHSCAGGDHTIYVGEVERAAVGDAKPLIYWRGNYRGIEN